MAVGTPAYMSPEQAAAEREPDGRSDVYSLGCVLFEMLTGTAPFTGPTAQALINKRFTEPVPSVRAARNEVTGALDQVVARALAREPDDRFASASALAQALASPGVVTPVSVTPPRTDAAPPRSIAVLPFANLSTDPENQYFADGVAEEIINALSKLEALRVTSRIASFAFRGKNEDLDEIGKKLNVATVLDGSVRRSGNRLRVTAQLVNVADGRQLWSERYDRQLEDIFAIQDEIAESIVKALRVMLTDQEKRAIERQPAADVQAYDYYLRGRQFFHQHRHTGIQFARRMFERALEIDPGYAIAHAGAADCSSFLYMYWDGSRANLEGADTHSRKALELGPALAEAHASRGLALSLSQRYQEAEGEFETAIRLNPKLYEAHYFYGRAAFQQGKHAAAVQHYQDASRVRPEDYQAVLLAVSSLRSLGLAPEAEATQRRGVQLAEKHLELNPDDARALYLCATALMDQGDRERALDWAGRALAIDPEDSAVLYNVGCVYAVGGLADDAIGCLEKAVQNGFGHRAWLENDSDFASLRGDPRFGALLARL
jgi:TolB-like protein/Flp pilus assembly protein TadD